MRRNAPPFTSVCFGAEAEETEGFSAAAVARFLINYTGYQTQNGCAVHLDFCSLIYMNRLPPCSSLIIIPNYFRYRPNLHFPAKSCHKTGEEVENNDVQTDARSINHSKEAAGLFKRLLRLYQHWDGAATRAQSRGYAEDTFNSCRTKYRLVTHTNVVSPAPPPPGLHFPKEKKKKQQKKSPACNSQASCQTF